MTITVPDTLPPISAYLDPTGLAPDRIDYTPSEGHARHADLGGTPSPCYAFLFGFFYHPTLWFPAPPATITQEPA